jgi:hypothetical protein
MAHLPDGSKDNVSPLSLQEQFSLVIKKSIALLNSTDHFDNFCGM